MSNEGIKGKLHTIPQIDETLTKEGFCADAKVVGEKLKEQNAKTEWGKLISGYGSEYPCDIPECEEVFFEIVNDSNDACTLKVPYSAIAGKNRKYYVGGHITPTVYFGATIHIENNTAYFKDSYLNGNYDSSATFNVYCKGVK